MVQLPYSTWSALQAAQIATKGSRLPVSISVYYIYDLTVCKQSSRDVNVTTL